MAKDPLLLHKTTDPPWSLNIQTTAVSKIAKPQTMAVNKPTKMFMVPMPEYQRAPPTADGNAIKSSLSGILSQNATFEDDDPSYPHDKHTILNRDRQLYQYQQKLPPVNSLTNVLPSSQKERRERKDLQCSKITPTDLPWSLSPTDVLPSHQRTKLLSDGHPTTKINDPVSITSLQTKTNVFDMIDDVFEEYEILCYKFENILLDNEMSQEDWEEELMLIQEMENEWQDHIYSNIKYENDVLYQTQDEILLQEEEDLQKWHEYELHTLDDDFHQNEKSRELYSQKLEKAEATYDNDDQLFPDLCAPVFNVRTTSINENAVFDNDDPPAPSVARRSSPVMRDKVIQYTYNIKQTSTTINQNNNSEGEIIRQKQSQKEVFTQIDNDRKLKRENDLNVTVKRKEQLLQLDNLKVEILNDRFEKRHRLNWLLGHEKTKQHEESSSQILKNANYFTIENCKDDDDDLLDDVANDNTDENERNNVNHQSHQDEYNKSKRKMAIEEMRVAARSEAAEKIKMAKEFRRHEMAKLAKERDDSKYNLNVNGSGCLTGTNFSTSNIANVIAGIRNSTLRKVLQCTEYKLYDSSDAFEPTIKIIKIFSGDCSLPVFHSSSSQSPSNNDGNVTFEDDNPSYYPSFAVRRTTPSHSTSTFFVRHPSPTVHRLPSLSPLTITVQSTIREIGRPTSGKLLTRMEHHMSNQNVINQTFDDDNQSTITTLRISSYTKRSSSNDENSIFDTDDPSFNSSTDSPPDVQRLSPRDHSCRQPPAVIHPPAVNREKSLENTTFENDDPSYRNQPSHIDEKGNETFKMMIHLLCLYQHRTYHHMHYCITIAYALACTTTTLNSSSFEPSPLIVNYHYHHSHQRRYFSTSSSM